MLYRGPRALDPLQPHHADLAYLKGRTGRQMGSRALVADSKETWVCAYLSFALLAAVGLNAAFGWWWADPRGRSPCSR